MREAPLLVRLRHEECDSKCIQPCVIAGGLRKEAHDEIERLSADISALKGLLREWREAEWMVSHDWGGNRDALHKKTLAALGEPDDGSYDSV